MLCFPLRSPNAPSLPPYRSRRLNDHSTPVRLIEALRDKSPDQATYDYVLDQVKPTMEELGISHPVELGLETAPK